MEKPHDRRTAEAMAMLLQELESERRRSNEVSSRIRVVARLALLTCAWLVPLTIAGAYTLAPNWLANLIVGGVLVSAALFAVSRCFPGFLRKAGALLGTTLKRRRFPWVRSSS